MRMSLTRFGLGLALLSVLACGLLSALSDRPWGRQTHAAQPAPSRPTPPGAAFAPADAGSQQVLTMDEAAAHRVALARDAPVAPAGAAGELRALVERHLLNAFLVPVLDDEHDPPRFADPSLLMACGTGAWVEVDGQPLRPGAVQGSRFRLRWTLDRCLPFGSGGPAFDGVAELEVTRGGPDDGVGGTPGLRAEVRLDGVHVERAGVSVVLTGRWTAMTP